MPASSTDGSDAIVTPPSAGVEAALDVAHLSRMTLGDRRLEREVLQLFDRQTEMLIERMRDAPVPARLSCAHTLKGSARNIGAWGVASAAEQVEKAAADTTDPTSALAAMAQLVRAVADARRAIALRLD